MARKRGPRAPALLGALIAIVSPSAGRAEPGKAVSAEPRAPVARRVWSRAPRTWIWAEPATKSRRLGYFRAGTALDLRSAEARPGAGCSGGFVAVEPRGHVCLGDGATLDRDDRYVQAMRHTAPADSAHPYHYAISNGAPMYRRFPTRDEQRRVERPLGEAGTFPSYPWHERHERLALVRGIEPNGEVPPFLADGGSARAAREGKLVRRFIPLGSMLAYTRAFEHTGRIWLLASDGTVVPADRVRPYRRSAFEGVRLGSGGRLPVAWVTGERATGFVRQGGEWVPAGKAWPRHRRLALAAGAKDDDSGYLPTRERDAQGRALWVLESDVAVARRRPPPAGVSEDDRWIHVSVSSGTLVAYEGTRPVFATLVSPGRGGVSSPGRDPVEASTTPRGSYRILYKYRTQTMSPDKDKPLAERKFWIDDVPYAQYFRIPFALHTAYWHDDFGTFMSGGCVNLSPRDGQWLFEWTRPNLPPGWHAVWAGGDNGSGTRVVVTR